MTTRAVKIMTFENASAVARQHRIVAIVRMPISVKEAARIADADRSPLSPTA